MNKVPKYLYIDDELNREGDESVEAVRDGFNDLGLIEVVVAEPLDFKAQKKALLEKLVDYDGLILDLRLDQNMILDVSYNAPAIAQELRTAVPNPDDNVKPCPIILCSTDDRMRATYDADQTSHDLFDYKFLKGSEPDWEKFSRKLKSLAEGYNWLRSEKRSTINSILGRENLIGVDHRVTERYEDPNNPNTTIYDYVTLVLKDIFHHPGPLVKERILAARLGIDISASGSSWTKLRDEVLIEFKYTGIFSTGWDRWWSDRLVDYFKVISNGKRLGTLNAKERVKVVSEHHKIEGLEAAPPLQYNTSSKFWTICEATKKPLDPLEGYKVFETQELKGWQEPKYLSFYAIAEEGLPKHRGLRPQKTELERVQSRKESLSAK